MSKGRYTEGDRRRIPKRSRNAVGKLEITTLIKLINTRDGALGVGDAGRHARDAAEDVRHAAQTNEEAKSREVSGRGYQRQSDMCQIHE